MIDDIDDIDDLGSLDNWRNPLHVMKTMVSLRFSLDQERVQV
jgi:hypothetical protein